MKDRPYFIALPEMVRDEAEMKTVISVLTAHFCPERLYLAGIPSLC